MARPLRFRTCNGTLRDRIRVHMARERATHAVLGDAWGVTEGYARQVMSAKTGRKITPARLNALAKPLRIDETELKALHLVAAREEGWLV